jgi:DNA/RNA endonuclease YhcR with UshA esterase domain
MDINDKKFNKQNYWGIILIIIIVATIAYYFGTSNKQQQIATPSTTSNQINQSNNPTSNTNTNVYNYTEAPNHIGEYASVRGIVVQVYQSKKGTIFFDYCTNYRSCPFSAVIFASAVKNFDNPFQYQGQQITVTGQIKSYEGRAEIILNTPNQISR